MKKLLEVAKNNNAIDYTDNWEICVSIAASYLSTSWREFYFTNIYDARRFRRVADDEGYAVLVVDRENY